MFSDDLTRGVISGAGAAMFAETLAEGLTPQGEVSAQEAESIKNWTKLATGMAALATGQDVNVALHTATNALDNNYTHWSQNRSPKGTDKDSDKVTIEEGEEEDEDSYSTPRVTNLPSEKDLTPQERKARADFERKMSLFDSIDDQFSEPYRFMTVGTLLADQVQQSTPGLEDRGRARAIGNQFSRKRSSSPPPVKTDLIKKLDTAQQTMGTYVPQFAKTSASEAQRIVGQGLTYVGENVPYAKEVGHGLRVGLDALDLGSHVRRSARSIGISQATAQDLGTLTNIGECFIGGSGLVKGVKNVVKNTRKLETVVDNASGFKGRKGFELKNPAYQPVRNSSSIINDRRFSGHALDQMQNRGIPPSVIENAIKQGKKTPDPKVGRIRNHDINNGLIVITEGSDVVTVIFKKGS